jgi:hypothetical protein
MARIQGKAPAATTAKRARTAPVAPRKTVDTREIPTGSEGSVVFTNEGVARDAGDTEIDTNVGHFDENKLAKLAFLEEPVTIIIAEASDKNQESHIFCAVNGVGPGPGGLPWLPRNIEITVARKYLEVLARARPVRVQTVERVNRDNGERYTEQKRSSSQRYPFQVIHDPNPRGRDWLKNLMLRRA